MPLNFRLDDYQLTKWQAIQSVFVSEYAIRHWNSGIKEKKWGHLAIALLEFIPLIGPLASIVERIAVYLFDKWTTIKPTLSMAQLKIRAQAVKNWQDKLCANVTRTMEANRNNTLVRSNPDIKLSIAQQELVQFLLSRLMKGHVPPGIQIIVKSNVWVFEIPSLPGLVFKVNPPDAEYTENFEERNEATLFANEIIERENLFLLHTPVQEILNLTLDNGEEAIILVEQKYDIEPSFEKQRGIYDYCLRTPQTKEFIKELFRQLIIFTIKTGWSDVKYDNMPLINDGTGVALIDMDISDNPIGGLISSNSIGRHGVLNYMTPELIGEFTPLLKELLTPLQFSRLKIDDIKKNAEKRQQILQNYPAYLKQQNIQDPFQNVNFFVARKSLKDIQDVVNDTFKKFKRKRFAQRETIDSDRAICLYAKESALAQLKKLKRIFDYQFEYEDIATVYC